MHFCKFCGEIIHWNYQREEWLPYDDMCHFNLHECIQKEE